MRFLVKISPLLMISAFLASCATSPTSGGKIFSMVSPEQENQLGAQQHAQSLKQFGGVNDTVQLNEFVARIGARLVPYAERKDVTWTFTVLDSEVVNAFAVPGGYVYVTRGLLALAQDESQVAAVLAHEMGHVNARHSAQQMSQGMLANLGLQVLGIATGSNIATQAGGVGADLFIKSYSRQHEYEADALSVRYLAKAGYDPYANAKFLAMLQQYTMFEQRMAGREAGQELFSYFSTHPQTADRIVRAQALADQAEKAPNPIINRAGYLNAIEGTAYGESADEGVVRGQSFIHSGLGIRFEAPQGFRIQNTPSKVVAQNTKGAALIFDMGKANTDDPGAYLSGVWATNAPLSGQERIDVNGFAAATAETRVNSNEGPKDARLIALSTGQGKFYRLAYVAPSGQLPGYATDFRRSTYSFRKLTNADMQEASPHRIRVVAVKSGDTIQSMTSRMSVSDFALERFCLLNGLTPNDVLKPGETVKTVQ